MTSQRNIPLIYFRCCPQCHPPERRKVVLTNPVKRKTNYNTNVHLDVVDIGSKATYFDEEGYRPNSGISRDSGILPDDIEDFDLTECTDPM